MHTGIRIDKHFIFVLVLIFSLSAPVIAQLPPSDTSTAWTSKRIQDQMRWKLENTDPEFGSPLSLTILLNAPSEKLDQLVSEADFSSTDPAQAKKKRTSLHRSVEALVLQENETATKQATEILNKLIELNAPEDISSIVTTHGVEFTGFTRRVESGNKVFEASAPNPQPQSVFNIRELTYEYAALFLLTGKPEYAANARDILLRFAEVAPSWPLYDRKNKPHPQSDERALLSGTINGLWGAWHPLDLRESLSLLRAYDIIRPTLTLEEKENIEKNFFIHQKALNDSMSRHQRIYSNLQGYRLSPLILFALVLERPDYVHEAVNYIHNLLRYSYTPDGFWKEFTPGYHQQITSRLMGSCALLTKGYSDPAGYIYEPDGTRFDNLDLHERFAVQFERMKTALQVLSMPDGTLLSLNDSWPKKDKATPSASLRLDSPGLLSVAGIAKLGTEKMVAFLQFDGIRGHDHDDPLNLVWFAGGREVFGETGYQALPDSGSTREWHSIAASHNTVIVNENMKQRDSNRLPPRLNVFKGESKNDFPFLAGADSLVRRPSREQIFDPRARQEALSPPGSSSAQSRMEFNYRDKEKPIVAAQPAAAQFANQGRLLIWDTPENATQAMEAEQEMAYPDITSLYRRTVVMIPTGNEDGILVDIFRIRGGGIHDFALRGGLDEPYTIEFDIPLQPASGELYKYVQLKKSAKVHPPLVATMRYPDGYEVRSRLSALFGTPVGELTLLTGEAPAIRRMGTAPFSFIRHQVPEQHRDFSELNNSLESCFVWVHEASRHGFSIQKVVVKRDNDNLVIYIRSKAREDWVFSALEPDSTIYSHNFRFKGKLASATTVDGKTTGRIHSGTLLKKEGHTIAEKAVSLSVPILKTLRKEAGDATDSVVFALPEGVSLHKYTLAHLDLGDVIRYSIPVTAIHSENQQVRIDLSHTPGFVIQGDSITMTNFPGWKFKGKVLLSLE